MTPLLAPFTLALALAAEPSPRAALPGQGEPVEVQADQLQYAPRRREITFTGKAGAPVTLTRGDARLTCARAVAKNDERGQIVTATCEGAVRFTRGERVITCDVAVFDNPRSRLSCQGSPVTLSEPGIEAEGTQLVYELDTEELKLENGRGRIAGARIDEAQEAQRARREKAP